MLIYIRHGNDHSEGNKHHHDRGLSDSGKRKASKQAARLIKKHGTPSIVHVSPFRRTLETYEAMAAHLDPRIQVVHDTRIAQYFGKKKKRRGIDIGRALAELAPVDADKAAFHLRVDQHIGEMKLANIHRSDVVVWCITHSVVLKYLSKQFDQRMSRPIEFLDYIVVGA